jgi:hypothetical protein
MVVIKEWLLVKCTQNGGGGGVMNVLNLCIKLLCSCSIGCILNSPSNLPMLLTVAARTLNLILLDVASREKHREIVARQSSDVYRSTGVPLFLCFARAATSGSIRLRVCVWVGSFQSFYILSLILNRTAANLIINEALTCN